VLGLYSAVAKYSSKSTKNIRFINGCHKHFKLFDTTNFQTHRLYLILKTALHQPDHQISQANWDL